MKKLIILAILCLLVGCSQTPKTTICTLEYENIDVVNTIVSTNHKVNTVTYQNTVSVEESLLPYMEQTVEEYASTLSGITGITYTYEFDNLTLIETVVIDYENADKSELYNLGFVEMVDGEIPNFVDYDLTLEQMKALGCACEEK